ncbi:hypothetical protein GQ54DRAFT_139425 [Martensiomyces pterosporus]|nr:hypothetical protein GQ54DRAFT_139425 [Martensiomyces pterosporus]
MRVAQVGFFLWARAQMRSHFCRVFLAARLSLPPWFSRFPPPLPHPLATSHSVFERRKRTRFAAVLYTHAYSCTHLNQPSAIHWQPRAMQAEEYEERSEVADVEEEEESGPLPIQHLELLFEFA